MAILSFGHFFIFSIFLCICRDCFEAGRLCPLAAGASQDYCEPRRLFFSKTRNTGIPTLARIIPHHPRRGRESVFVSGHARSRYAACYFREPAARPRNMDFWMFLNARLVFERLGNIPLAFAVEKPGRTHNQFWRDGLQHATIADPVAGGT